MARVTGIGGIFFKSEDPEKLAAWYAQHLGVEVDEYGSLRFDIAPQAKADPDGYSIWTPFPRETQYFDPSQASFMVNFRVDDLDALLEHLKADGVKVDPKLEEYDFGRFAWIMDPEGNRVELWEPGRSADGNA